MLIKVKKLHPDARLPIYATPGSAGADLFAHILNDAGRRTSVRLYPGERRLVGTGLAFEVSPGFEVQIRPRSGLALRDGVTVLNTPGCIDSDYRGEIGVILFNAGRYSLWLESGARVAQMTIAPVIIGDFIEVHELTHTARGAGGFGSSGA